MKPKSHLLRVLYVLRDLRSRKLYRALHEHCLGDVLEVGGWDFFVCAADKGVSFMRWTTLERDQERLLETEVQRVTLR